MITLPLGKWKPFASPPKLLKSWPKGRLVLLVGLCVQGSRAGVGWGQLPPGSAEALGSAGRGAECLTTSMRSLLSSLRGVMCQQTAIGLHAVTQGGGIPLEGPSPAAALPSCNLRPLPPALSFQGSSQEC